MEGHDNLPETTLSRFNVASLCGNHENPEHVLKEGQTEFPHDGTSIGMPNPPPQIKLFLG